MLIWVRRQVSQSSIANDNTLTAHTHKQNFMLNILQHFCWILYSCWFSFSFYIFCQNAHVLPHFIFHFELMVYSFRWLSFQFLFYCLLFCSFFPHLFALNAGNIIQDKFNAKYNIFCERKWKITFSLFFFSFDFLFCLVLFYMLDKCLGKLGGLIYI